MCSGFVPRKRCLCSYLVFFRFSLLQNPRRHLGRGNHDARFIIAMPPRVVVVEARIYRNNTFPAVVARGTQRRSLLRAPSSTSKTTRTPLEPPHPMIGTARPDRAVDATSLGLPRLERSWRTQSEISIATRGTIRAGRAGLDVIVYGDIMAPR